MGASCLTCLTNGSDHYAVARQAIPVRPTVLNFIVIYDANVISSALRRILIAAFISRSNTCPQLGQT